MCVIIKKKGLKDDKFYIERVAKGDVNAYSYLVDKHKSFVYTIALKMLKNSEDAEELAQDTFVKAFKSLKEFKFESKFSTWLYRITYNGAISKLRKKQIEISDVDNDSLAENEVVSTYSTIGDLRKEEQKKYINLALEQLREDDALLITLYYLNECSTEEISEIMELSVANVKVKLHRSRKKFYDELKLILNEEVKTIL